jgi:hypothetical protein
MSDIPPEEYFEDTTEEEIDALRTDEMMKLHALAMEQLGRAVTATWDECVQAAEDRRFVDIAGAQYDGEFFARFENKPKLEFNKTALSVMRIINEYRNNPITVNFVARDGQDTKDAETCDGLLRADMQSSYGDLAILNAFEEAVKGGKGAYRIVTCYEDEEDPDNEYQRIKFEAIYDADKSVFFDLDAKNQDKSDARHCFVVYSMSRASFEEEFDLPAPDSVPVVYPDFAGIWDWFGPDVVYIAEWYRIEEHTETLQTWVDIGGNEVKYWLDDFKADPDLKKTLIATGSKKIKDRRIPRRRVHKYLISGSQIIRDCGIIAGKYIPIIPVYGMRSFINNMERFHGQVRNLKDPQRLFNMQVSKLAEIAAFSPVSKPIFTPEQMMGHETLWAEDNVNDNPFLLVNPIMDKDGNAMPAGPIGYTKAPEVPQALAAITQITDTAMKEISGQNESMQAVPANTSAAAIDSVFNRMDMQVYIFVSNLAVAVRWGGNVYLPIAQEVYTEKGRKMKVIGTSGDVSSIELMKPVDEAGVTGYDNNLTKASFEVVSSVGPSSTTKRQAMVRTLTDVMSKIQDPQAAQILLSAIVMNTEGEGLQGLQKYFRSKLVEAGAEEPNDEEKKAAEEAAKNAQPDPQAEYLKAVAQQAQAAAQKDQASILKILADVEATRADAEQTKADTEKTHAETLQILGQVQATMEQQRAEIQAMGEAFKSMMAPAPAQPVAVPEAPKPGIIEGIRGLFGGGGK